MRVPCRLFHFTRSKSDPVVVLFEEVDGEQRYNAGDDDSAEDRNACLRVKLYESRKYVLRVRLYNSNIAGGTAVIMS